MVRSLNPNNVVALIDTREQCPFDLSPLAMEPATLATGDYSVKGLESFVAIERKSLTDLLACCGRERDRFERELHRLLSYSVKAVVVESSWAAVDFGQWRSQITSKQVSGSIIGWISLGVPFILAGTRERAAAITSRMLFTAARRRLRECDELLKAVDQPTD